MLLIPYFLPRNSPFNFDQMRSTLSALMTGTIPFILHKKSIRLQMDPCSSSYRFASVQHGPAFVFFFLFKLINRADFFDDAFL